MASRFHKLGTGWRAWAITAVAAWPWGLCVGQGAVAGGRQPVLVELFTSEGCSDCPAADRLLERLDATQFVPGAEAIVLSEHVTYWNYLGWRDPFSLEDADARQQRYGKLFGLNSIYTPQAVVDGAAQMVGSDEQALRRAVAAAASRPKGELRIESAHWEMDEVRFAVKGALDPGARLVAVLAEDATHSEVARGENAGRTLHHVAVVRVLKEFGAAWADGRTLELPDGSMEHRGEAAGPVRLVVFAADGRSGSVLAAAEQTLRR